MTLYLQSGDKFYAKTRESLDVHDHLPAQTYSIGVAGDGALFLQIIDPLQTRGKLYGDTKKNADRIVSTFLDRSVSTGVLLAGEKGSGKGDSENLRTKRNYTRGRSTYKYL
jgi:hypothetical protein